MGIRTIELPEADAVDARRYLRDFFPEVFAPDAVFRIDHDGGETVTIVLDNDEAAMALMLAFLP